MGEAFATTVVSNILERLFAPIGCQFEYVLCYKKCVKDLENGVRELEIARKRVQSSVDEAVYDRKLIHVDVENWLKSVKEETEKADDLLKYNESAKDACFHGWLPNPVVRHQIGRKVKKITRVIQGFHKESKNSIFQKVYYENTPIGIVTATTSASISAQRKEDVLVSRASIIEDVIKAITDDNVYVIGVYGPGGVGKSKLMEDVEKRVKEEQLFDVVATTNISRNPDLKIIQGEIAYALGLNLMNQETARGRADLLCKRLEEDPEKKILIILDNLWTKLELKEVGIPCGYDNKVRGCKLLLTSRYRHVLYTEMGSDQEFQLRELTHGEACMLFERTVGDRVNDPEFKILVDRVVNNCGGLPLLILSVAKRLKRGDLPEWRDASTDRGSNVKSIVELNYNDLKDERIKSLFLIHALKSGNTYIRDALIYGMGLGLYKKFSETIEHARDRLIMDQRRLLDSSLLQGSDDLDWLGMHDLYTDVAISMHDKFIDTEWNALVGRKDFGFKEWSKYDLRKCTAMAFNNVGIDELPKKLDCPNMRILSLLERNRFLKMHESFFESMEKLQVLDLTGLSFTRLPSSMEFLEKLTTLCLDNCHLEDVTTLEKLKGLQFLSFIESTIARIPKEIGKLTELRFLDLRGCTALKVIEPGVLESLVNLEELKMRNSFDQWEAEDETPRSNASLAEFKKMKKLSTLYIAIPHLANLSRDLPFGKLKKHEILIGDVWRWSDKYKESRTLKLKLDSGNLLHEEWVQRCLQRTQDLHLEGLRDNHSIHDLCFEGFLELKHLHVQNSPSLQYVVHSIEHIHCTALSRLESLFLENLNKLENICHGRLASESFSKIKIVKLDNCGEIKYLFPSSMMRIFLQLEDIEISRCHLMKQIVVDAEADEDGDEIDVDPKVKSFNLRWLTLRNLPEMTSFYKIMDHSVVFFDIQQLIKLQNLEAITIEKCQSIREVFDLEELTTSGDVEILCRLTRLTLNGLPSLECIWNKNPRRVSSFRNLKALKVQNCENLRFLFSSSMAKALVQIKEMEIVSCVLMEEIMYVQEEESAEVTTTDTLEFPLLTSLSLVELPNLKTFSFGKYCIHCPSLTRLTISKCPKMMTFSSFEGRDLQQAFGRINSCSSLPGFFNEKVHFPSLEELKLSSMCQLKWIWHNQLLGQSFCKLASLSVELCENLSHVFPSNSMGMLQSLNKIKAVGCPSLEALFESTSLTANGRKKPLVLPALREMTLLNLSRLRDILKSDCKVTLAFPSLMEVNVRGCHSLPYLFSSATAKTLDKLAVLDISYCNNLRGIIAMEEGKGKTLETFKFRQLSILKLGDLENLIGFWSCAGDGLHPPFDEKDCCEYQSRISTLPLLKELRVRHCSKMRSFLFICDYQSCQDTSTSENQPALFSFDKVMPNLKGLTLTREDVMMMMQQHYIFGNLRELHLTCYHDETVVFPTDFLLHRFPNLEVLSLSCSSLEEIFSEDAFGHGGAIASGESADMQTPLKALKNLKQLELNKLCKLQRVWKDGSLMAEILKQIETLVVSECSSLSIILPSLIAFQRLTELEVKDCAGLVHMGTCSAVTGMVHLTWLTLRNCGAMEDVVTDDGNEVEEISFPKLRRLTLDDLPSLESFSSTNCAVKFPLLGKIIIMRCPKMNIFCKGALRTPNLDKVFLSEEDGEGRWEGNINTTIQTLLA